MKPKPNRARVRINGVYKLVHVIVWERVNGPKPPGMQIHHRDGDPFNNALENLQLVTPTEHKRIHGGCVLRDGVWWKPCTDCKAFKPIDREHWYFTSRSPDWPHFPWCRSCHVRRMVEAKRRRRARAS